MPTDAPVAAPVGVNELIFDTGGGGTPKLAAVVAVPVGLVTWIVPLVAVSGTTAVSKVGDVTSTVLDDAPLNLTVVAPGANPEPVIVTTVPGAPDVGRNELAPMTQSGSLN